MTVAASAGRHARHLHRRHRNETRRPERLGHLGTTDRRARHPRRAHGSHRLLPRRPWCTSALRLPRRRQSGHVRGRHRAPRRRARTCCCRRPATRPALSTRASCRRSASCRTLPEWIAEMRRDRKRQRNQKTERVAAGERHERWVEEAGRLRKQGVPVAEARRRLLELRAQEFENPDEKTDEELDAILDAYAEDWDGAELQDDVVWLSAFDLKQVEWVERPLLQIAFTLLAGRPGIGKGALVARLVARCTNGEMYGEPRPAILLSTEDDPEIDLGPRIEVAGGDRSLVAMPPTSFQLPRDIDWLRGYVRSNQRARARQHRPDRDRPRRQPHRRREHRPRERSADGADAARRARQRAEGADRRRPSPVHQGGEGRRARQGARLDRLDRRPPCRARRRRRLQRPGAPARPRRSRATGYHAGRPAAASSSKGERCPGSPSRSSTRSRTASPMSTSTRNSQARRARPSRRATSRASCSSRRCARPAGRWSRTNSTRSSPPGPD